MAHKAGADRGDTREPWRDLRVGDRIRFTGIPDGWSLPHAHVPACTRALVDKLVAQRIVVQVDHLDEFDMPWIFYESFAEDGREQADYLSIHDLVWERVTSPGSASRRRRSRRVAVLRVRALRQALRGGVHPRRDDQAQPSGRHGPCSATEGARGGAPHRGRRDGPPRLRGRRSSGPRRPVTKRIENMFHDLLREVPGETLDEGFDGGQRAGRPGGASAWGVGEAWA